MGKTKKLLQPAGLGGPGRARLVVVAPGPQLHERALPVITNVASERCRPVKRGAEALRATDGVGARKALWLKKPAATQACYTYLSLSLLIHISLSKRSAGAYDGLQR
ncbi:hypothetical protein PHYPSEUDO_010114 [Phytophthora pseudosyringae]|uniref:Uncharacterized protein n=1 Tax=Phytophthora pseudosyringae TaxID=221518 RepID=A0A8T1VG01_9STRA|nr:hypothetical protein PHYPSEUDO_010114 [Phytophthora pseudosyringae]